MLTGVCPLWTQGLDEMGSPDCSYITNCSIKVQDVAQGSSSKIQESRAQVLLTSPCLGAPRCRSVQRCEGPVGRNSVPAGRKRRQGKGWSIKFTSWFFELCDKRYLSSICLHSPSPPHQLCLTASLLPSVTALLPSAWVGSPQWQRGWFHFYFLHVALIGK